MHSNNYLEGRAPIPSFFVSIVFVTINEKLRLAPRAVAVAH